MQLQLFSQVRLIAWAKSFYDSHEIRMLLLPKLAIGCSEFKSAGNPLAKVCEDNISGLVVRRTVSFMRLFHKDSFRIER